MLSFLFIFSRYPSTVLLNMVHSVAGLLFKSDDANEQPENPMNATRKQAVKRGRLRTILFSEVDL
ncbi:hypothetical protein BCEP4_320015 [Burkholderia cepacia]|nr:hypothetical protein BCEP4_320015 [Burkholderia cepacia]